VLRKKKGGGGLCYLHNISIPAPSRVIKAGDKRISVINYIQRNITTVITTTTPNHIQGYKNPPKTDSQMVKNTMKNRY
jgi:hypothetical protein